MKSHSKLILASVVMTAVAFLPACTKSSNDAKGKVLQIILKDNAKTADPNNASDIVSAEVIYQVYEPLYQYNYFSETYDVVPLTADGMPEFSKDGLTVKVKLKKGIRFQDDPCFKATNGKGRELKAQDYIYSWKRSANPATEPQGFWIWEGKIVGLDEFSKKFAANKDADAVMNEEIEGMKALDDYTIQLKLTRPYPQLMYALTMSYAAPIPKEAVDFHGKDLTNHPVGTGPFKVVSYDPTSKIVMTRNENFRDEFFPDASMLSPKYKGMAAYAGKKLPLVDGIEFHIVKEEQPRWLGFLKGKYDQLELPKDNYDAAIHNKTDVKPELKEKGIFVSIEPGFHFWWVGINTKDKLLGSNKYLRQAIASAINGEQWLKLFKNGRGSVQTELSPLGVVDRCGKPYKLSYSVERAKELLKKAGYPNGEGLPVIKYDTRNSDMSERQLAEFIQKSLGEIGIKIDVNVNLFPAYLDKMNKKNLQLSKGGWIMDYPDAENNYQLFYGPNQAPGPNLSNFDHPEFNKLYVKIAAMKPSAERKKLICRAEEILQEEAPMAYGIYEDQYRLAQGRLKNFHTADFIYTKWKFVDLESSKDGDAK
ncbi:MAG: ABC transporter substrate-binding protein [Bdellovibrionota bacterium]